MKYTLISLLVAASAWELADAQDQDMPTCLSTCITPFPGNHEPDTCSANWTSTVSSCIDQACSVSISSQQDGNMRTSMFLSPNKETSCQEALVPGQEQSSTSLQLQPGVCAQSPYFFQSFLVSYGQNTVEGGCMLHLFNESNCIGEARNTSLGTDGSMSDECMIGNGSSVMLTCGLGDDSNPSDNQAAHSYISSICHISSSSTSTTHRTNSLSTTTAHHTSASTLVADPTTTFVTDPTTTFAADPSTTLITSPTTTLVANPITLTNMTTNSTITYVSPIFANATIHTTSLMYSSSIVVSGPVGDASESEKAVKRNSAAQWALVVVVFARSLMF